MGVTIHFEGQLKSNEDFDIVISKAENFAIENNMEFARFKVPSKKLDRVKDEEDWNYEGPTRGIKIQPDINSDPLWLEFDKDNYIQEYCKTQFAGIDVHLKLVNLLKRIESNFVELSVVDEGEFWDSNDIDLLQSSFDNYFKAAEKAKVENSKLNGPFRLQDGRIIDLMEDN